MRIPVNFQIGFADAELSHYVRQGSQVSVIIKAWNATRIAAIFTDVIGVRDFGLGDISDLCEESDTSSEFLRYALNHEYEKVPETIPYRLFAFLDLDGEPALEVVATKIEIRLDDS